MSCSSVVWMLSSFGWPPFLGHYPPRHSGTVYHTMIIYCEVSCSECWQKEQDRTQYSQIDSMESSVQYCASRDLLRETRNVIGCISINSAWAVKPFQPFVSPTVIPVNGTKSRGLPVLWTQQKIVLFSVYTKHFQPHTQNLCLSLEGELLKYDSINVIY